MNAKDEYISTMNTFTLIKKKKEDKAMKKRERAGSDMSNSSLNTNSLHNSEGPGDH